jgi:hypothetical protein
MASCREKYVRQLQHWIGVDVYGECGPLACGQVQNVLLEYDPGRDPCFQLVNLKYRYTVHTVHKSEIAYI